MCNIVDCVFYHLFRLGLLWLSNRFFSRLLQESFPTSDRRKSPFSKYVISFYHTSWSFPHCNNVWSYFLSLLSWCWNFNLYNTLSQGNTLVPPSLSIFLSLSLRDYSTPILFSSTITKWASFIVGYHGNSMGVVRTTYAVLQHSLLCYCVCIHYIYSWLHECTCLVILCQTNETTLLLAAGFSSGMCLMYWIPWELLVWLRQC